MIKAGRMRWVGHTARIEEKNAYRILVETPEEKRSLGRPRRRSADDITVDLREKIWGGMVWIDLAHDRDQWRTVENTEMNPR
jgi:hypothetical protein